MFTITLLLAACANNPTPAALPEAPEPASAAAPSPDDGAVTLDTDAGQVRIHPTYHATTRIHLGETVVWLDPWSKADLESAPRADIVLITDNHFDHDDAEALAKVTKDTTQIVSTATVRDAKPDRTIHHVLANGESATIGDVTIEAVPMYNLTRGPEEGGVFHEKGRGNGYVIRYGGKSIYFAGDTECTPEMKALTGIDLAFLPMNLPYTMTPAEAADCVNAFKPVTVVPYHYAGSDLAAFSAAVNVPGVTVKTVDFYPGGLPW